MLLLVTIFLGGCAEQRQAARPARPFPEKVALLPVSNYSNSMVGPVLLRKIIEEYLLASTMEVQETGDTDEALKTIGISQGGQLNSSTPQKLGELLEVDGLLYCELLDFSYTNIGVMSKRSVKARLLLVETATGARLWETEKESVGSRAALSADAIKENFARGMGEKLLETAMRSPLRPETEDVAHALLKDLARARKGE